MPKRGDPWFRFYPDEWLDGTRGLSLEERGAYIDFICLQMRHESHLDHDYRWFGHQLHCDQRKARHIVETLVEKMKLQRDERGLYNARSDEEIAWKESQRRSASSAASSRWKNRTEIDAQPPVDLAATPPHVSGGRAEVEPRSINDALAGHAKKDEQKQRKDTCERTAVAVPRARSRDIDRDIEEEITPLSPPSGGRQRRGSDRGSRLPDDWLLPEEWHAVTVAQFEISSSQIVTEANTFRDHWLSTAGEKGRKTDWQRTWNNWIRRKYRERSSAPAAVERRMVGAWWLNPAAVARMSVERWRKGISEFANGIWPVDKLGPPPGHKDCVVPPELIEELQLDKKYDDRGIARPGYAAAH